MIYNAAFTCEWNTGSWASIAASVLRIPDGVSQLSGGGDNPLAFGDSAESSFSIDVLDTLTGGADVTGRPIRVTFTIDATTVMALVGTIQEQSEESGSGTVTLSCIGVSEQIRVTKAYSPALHLRPAATQTTATSVEDYTDPAWQAGLMNYVLWRAGGRPYDQAGSYPSASFYYDLDHAILTPTWAWVAGEDGWSELQKLAQAAGGMLYQDTLGVVRYRSPLSLIGNSPTYTFDNTVYASARRSRKRGQLATKVIVSYLPREARPLQQVLDDTTPRLIHDGETITFTLEPQWPLKSLELINGVVDIQGFDGSENFGTQALIITDLTGEAIAQGGTGYSHQIVAGAQRIEISVTNFASRPIVLWRVVLRGEPITAGEAGNVEVGSGTAERQVSDNPYIQSKHHANRLANLILTFYGSARAAVELNDCVYDPNRTVGEIVGFTATRWGVSGVSHVITRIAPKETGAKADYTIVPVAGLPAVGDYYTVSASAQSGPKLVAF